MSEEMATYGQQRQEGCIFCTDEIASRTIASHGSVFAIEDKFPVTDGHILIIPYRHVSDFFTMSSKEVLDAQELILMMKNKILGGDSAVSGFNVGVNCGETAGQTVMHAHIHLIPRREGDVADPRGGVRHLIAGKGYY